MIIDKKSNSIKIKQNNNINKRKLGKEYEEKAAIYLSDKGYRIIDKNIFTPFGEIDILAEEKETLVFVEIKYRSSNKCGDPLESVNYNKQKKICKSALYIYSRKGFYFDKPCRFDVVAVNKDEINHVKNAFDFFM